MARREDLPFAELINEPVDEWIQKHPPPWIVEPKIDGEDLLIVKRTENTLVDPLRIGPSLTPAGTVFQPIYGINRYGTIYTPKELPCLADISINQGSYILRGEMNVPGKKVYDLRHAISSSPQDIHIAVHDCIEWNGTDERNQPLSVRKSMIMQILYQTAQNPDSRVTRLEQLSDYRLMREHPRNFDVNDLVLNMHGVLQLYDLALKQGYEGIVVKPVHSIYKDNVSLKLKSVVTWDVLITAVKDTDKLRTDQIPWSFRMEVYTNTGERLYVGDVSSGENFNVEARRRIWEAIKPTLGEATRMNKEIYYPLAVPLVAEVRAQEILRTNGNTRLRHPVIVRFRQDKPLEQCIIQV